MTFLKASGFLMEGEVPFLVSRRKKDQMLLSKMRILTKLWA